MVKITSLNQNTNLHNKTEVEINVNESQELSNLIIDAIQDIKGKNILKLDLRHLDDAPTDFFIICEGDSGTQISAIANNIHKRVKEELGLHPSHREGQSQAKWVLVDYFNIIIHIFYPETRAFYEIEDLWGDAKITEYQNI